MKTQRSTNKKNTITLYAPHDSEHGIDELITFITRDIGVSTKDLNIRLGYQYQTVQCSPVPFRITVFVVEFEVPPMLLQVHAPLYGSLGEDTGLTRPITMQELESRLQTRFDLFNSKPKSPSRFKQWFKREFL